ncbi:MAG TPA: PQQ-binding-like beta-propeller repeat protein [Kofleriaceae bacterium]|nr:PQQ-binding-like beta-propeller repeat protein [Kofleriaceae bacterium]
MRVIQVKCPNCAASLRADPEAQTVVCEYCHTTSAVQRRSRIMQIPLKVALADPPSQVAREKVRRVILAVVLSCVLLPIVLGVVIAVQVHNQVTSFSQNTAQTAADSIRRQAESEIARAFGGKSGLKIQIGPGGPRVEQAATWQGTGAVLLLDVDGDKVSDVIGRARYVMNGDTIKIGAWSGATGKKLWESASIGSYTDTYQGYLLLIGDLLVFADSTATLTGYSTADGARRWATQLPDRTETACLDASGALHVKTVDGTWHAVAIADGARTAGRGPGRCLPVPNDRLPGAAEILRGRPGQTPKVEGMRVGDVAQLGEDGPRVAVGTRERGTAVPMLARVDEPRWAVEVPSQDALRATATRDLLAMTSDRVCTVYELESRSAPRLTCFDMATGSRAWDTEIAKGVTIVMESLVASRDRLFLSSWGHVQIFDLATGRSLHLIGEL